MEPVRVSSTPELRTRPALMNWEDHPEAGGMATENSWFFESLVVRNEELRELAQSLRRAG